MRYSTIRKFDATNWDGINTTIFFTGCTFGCPGCFNEEIQDFNTGHELTNDVIGEFITAAKSKHISGVCILGGEPFQQDLDMLYDFIYIIKKEVKKPIHIWTGFSYERLITNDKIKEILSMVDTLVDGLFIQDLKELNLKYRGSSNQRVIDIYRSIDCDEVVEMCV